MMWTSLNVARVRIARRAFSTAPLVSSWNEWDTLEEVVVGIADGSAIPPLHPAEEAKIFHLSNTKDVAGTLRSSQKIEAANAELDGFCKILSERGITVRRPTVEPNVPFSTPYFETSLQNGATCPRDIITVIGNAIIEAPTPWRSRNFEFAAYRSLLMFYFQNDPEMQWCPAPFPALKDEIFRDGYAETHAQRAEQMMARTFVTQDGVEPVFDAADILRFGSDIFVLHGHTCNKAGFEWIKRQVARLDVRAHLISMPKILNPSHIDASIMPLRPGLLLASPLVVDDLDVFRDNGWEIVTCVEPDSDPTLDPSYRGKSGKWISMNVLSLSPDEVCVMEHDEAVARQLESLGMKVTTVPFRSVVEFGGALHCCTMDIRRRGARSPESLFPNL
eukprot:g743.t1